MYWHCCIRRPITFSAIPASLVQGSLFFIMMMFEISPPSCVSWASPRIFAHLIITSMCRRRGEVKLPSTSHMRPWRIRNQAYVLGRGKTQQVLFKVPDPTQNSSQKCYPSQTRGTRLIQCHLGWNSCMLPPHPLAQCLLPPSPHVCIGPVIMCGLKSPASPSFYPFPTLRSRRRKKERLKKPNWRCRSTSNGWQYDNSCHTCDKARHDTHAHTHTYMRT